MATEIRDQLQRDRRAGPRPPVRGLGAGEQARALLSKLGAACRPHGPASPHAPGEHLLRHPYRPGHDVL